MKKQYDFQTVTHAKCILVGEHAVLRGYAGIVFPIKSKYLKLYFRNTNNQVLARCVSHYSDVLLTAFWTLLEDSLKALDKHSLHKNNGEFFIKNTIPMGYGMGFSSAICVAVARWILWKGWIQQNELFAFAKHLEDSFHGKSSGIDIAGVIADSGISFNKTIGARKITLNWKPRLYISSSEFSSCTSKCIAQVEQLWEQNKALAKSIDKEMGKCAHLSEQAFGMNEKEGIVYLANAISKANDCFQKWGLINSELAEHIKILLSRGAMAAKPTGSGAGGYILSLWKEEPPQDLPFKLVPLFLAEDEPVILEKAA